MKRIFIYFWIIFSCLNCIANETNSCWIISKDGIYFGTKIRLHSHKAYIVFENGGEMAIPVNDISSFALNGNVFEKLPLYKNGKLTSRLVFMELVCRSKYCSLYRYGHCTIKCVSFREGMYNYYIYKGENLQLASNCIGLPQACQYDTNKQRYK